MSAPNNPVDEFVVEVDQDAVLRARANVFTTLAFSAWVSLVAGGIVIALSAVLALGFNNVGGWIMSVSGVILLFDGGRRLTKIHRERDKLMAIGVAPVAMRMSFDGLRCGIDAAPDSIFLPWHTVAGFRLKRWRGKQLLVLELAPGVTSDTAGVEGLGHPEVQPVLHRKVLGVKGLRVATSILKQPVQVIDQALAHFSGGRARVR